MISNAVSALMTLVLNTCLMLVAFYCIFLALHELWVRISSMLGVSVVGSSDNIGRNVSNASHLGASFPATACVVASHLNAANFIQHNFSID